MSLFSSKHSDAMSIAREARDMAIISSTELRAHVAECSKSWERLNQTMTQNEASRRDDQSQWRESLGRRLDKQDTINRGNLVAVIMVLLSVLGSVFYFLMPHLGMFPAH